MPTDRERIAEVADRVTDDQGVRPVTGVGAAHTYTLHRVETEDEVVRYAADNPKCPIDGEIAVDRDAFDDRATSRLRVEVWGTDRKS